MKTSFQPFSRLCTVLLLFAGTILRAQDCNSGFYQFKENSTFTLTTFDNKDKPLSRSVHRYQQVTRSGGGVTAEVEQELFDNKDKSLNKSRYEISCQNGVIKLNIHDLMGPGMNLQQTNIRMEMTGDALDLPGNLAVGQTLNGGTFHINGTMGELKIMDRDFTVKERKVEGKETLDTPAGSYDCYKITYLMETQGMIGKMRTFKTTTWYAKGPGLVKTVSYDEKGKTTGYTLLTGYTK